MRIGLCFLLSLILVNVLAQTDRKVSAGSVIIQSAIEVPLERQNGDGPFFGGGGITSSEESGIEYLIPIRLKLKLFRIRYFDFEPEQTAYERFNQGKITRSKMISVLKSHQSDTTQLTRSKFNHRMPILFGMDSLKNYVLIADRNFNNSFLDDSIQSYTYYPSPELEVEARRSLRPQKIYHQYFNGRDTVTRYSWILFDPYRGNLSMMVHDRVDSILFLSIGYAEHRQAIFSFHGKNFRVAVHNMGASVKYNDRRRINLFFADAKDEFKSQADGNVPYKIGDVATLGNYQLRIDSISSFGTRLFITDLGYQRFPEGHLPGQYVANVNALKLNRSKFNFRDYKKKYLLLDFWGTWCGPCIEALPKVKKIAKTYKTNELAVVGVAFDRSPDEVSDFVVKNGITWEQVFQNRKDITDVDLVIKLKVNEYPTVFLIDPTGKILMRENSIDRIESKLRLLLKPKQP